MNLRATTLAGLAVAAALALAPAAATAAATGAIFIGGLGSGSVRETTLPVHVRGALVVRFRGDEAAGCAGAGTCAYSGTVTWTPPPDALLLVAEFGRHHGRAVAVMFFGLGFEGGSGHDPVAQVQRSSAGGDAGVCADVAESGGEAVELTGRGRRLDIGPPRAGDLLRSRCAGPLGSDVARAFPSRVVSAGRLRRGRMTIDLSGRRSFSAHGFSGTVESTLELDVRRPRHSSEGRPPQHVRTRVVRTRVVEVHYAVKGLVGEQRTVFSGLADDPLCGPLDACGTSGSLTLTPDATRGELELVAEAPASRSRRDLLAALGLRGRGRRRGVNTYGYGSWESDSGRIAATLSRTDGTPDCHDAVPLRRGGLDVERRAGGMRVEYGSGFGAGHDPWRTRCPGPLATDLSAAGTVASAINPLSAFRHRTVTLRLDVPRRFSHDGYAGSSTSDLTLVLRRRSVHERVVVERIPLELFARPQRP